MTNAVFFQVPILYIEREKYRGINNIEKGFNKV